MALSLSSGSRRACPVPRRCRRVGAPFLIAGRCGLGGRGRARLAGRAGRASCRSSGRRGGRRFASLLAPCRMPPAVRAGRRARLAGSPRRWRCGCRGRCASWDGLPLVVVVAVGLVDQIRSVVRLQALMLAAAGVFRAAAAERADPRSRAARDASGARARTPCRPVPGHG